MGEARSTGHLRIQGVGHIVVPGLSPLDPDGSGTRLQSGVHVRANAVPHHEGIVEAHHAKVPGRPLECLPGLPRGDPDSREAQHRLHPRGPDTGELVVGEPGLGVENGGEGGGEAAKSLDGAGEEGGRAFDPIRQRFHPAAGARVDLPPGFRREAQIGVPKGGGEAKGAKSHEGDELHLHHLVVDPLHFTSLETFRYQSIKEGGATTAELGAGVHQGVVEVHEDEARFHGRKIWGARGWVKRPEPGRTGGLPLAEPRSPWPVDSMIELRTSRTWVWAALALAGTVLFSLPAAAQPSEAPSRVGAPLFLGTAPEIGEWLEADALRRGRFVDGWEVGLLLRHTLDDVDTRSLPPGSGMTVGSAPPFFLEVTGGGRWGDELLPVGSGAFAGVAGFVAPGTRWGVQGQVVAGGPDVPGTLQEARISVGAGGAVFWGGRGRMRLGPGSDALLLSGVQFFDGMGVGTASPARLPGPLRHLGLWQGNLSVGRLPEVGVVADPYYGVLSVTLDPATWIRLGANRTVVFGGEGMPEVTAERVWRMILGRHSTDVGEFEDQHAEFFLKVRVPTPLGPTSAYASWAINDSEGAIRDSPGFLGGVLLAHELAGWEAVLRYEFIAYGARARWCRDCARRERIWFLHYVYGPHTTGGHPLASSLGGDGARQTLRWSGWSPGGRLALSVTGEVASREPTNLLYEEFPDRRRAIEVEGRVAPIPNLHLRIAPHLAGADSESVRPGLRVSAEWTFTGSTAHR